MMRWAQALLLAGAVGCTAGCSDFAFFEDVGVDPHPPEVTMVGIGLVPPPEPEPEPPPPAGLLPASRATFETGGFSVTALDKFRITVNYSDVGADIVSIRLRDRDGIGTWSGGPVAPKIDTDGDGVPDDEGPRPPFFPGRAGTAVVDNLTMAASIAGPHRIEMWAEDSQGSRSEKTEFVVTFTF
jgi:hypothetical protein